ncbi:uncharacterized protein LOC132758200 [Ruditapes philippinarum]|uniref:uncharacterized protein LOC132758200 n=1 Tax=Ruditapes philippinarum TaxID=129788 RepID=UPI00295B7A04|nr:uncharacterized protein LOC132758200 [Ruditapes philippinarum]
MKIIILILTVFGTHPEVDCVDILQDLASLDPVNPVVKAGDVVMFQCTSPPNYTGEEYETIHFKFLHNGTEFTTTESTESIKGVHSVKKISIEIKGLEDSGNYTCVVTPSIPEMTVRVETHLYVIKDEEMTEFGEDGEVTKLSWLGSSNYPALTCIWKVNGHKVEEPESRVYEIQHTVKDDAFKSYTCVLISKKSLKAYGNKWETEADVEEVQIKLRVIEIVDCTEVHVHGVTPVLISWIKDEEVFNASLSFGSNVTIGQLPPVNFTSTSVIQLVVTDGNHIFKKNLTKDSGAEERTAISGQSNHVGAIVGGVIAVLVVLAGIAGCCIYKKKFKRESKGNKDELNESQKPLNKDNKPNASKCGVM